MQRGGHNVLQMIEFSQSMCFDRGSRLKAHSVKMFVYFVSFLKLHFGLIFILFFGKLESVNP